MFWISLLLFLAGLYFFIDTTIVLKKYKKIYGEDLERFLNGYK